MSDAQEVEVLSINHSVFRYLTMERRKKKTEPELEGIVDGLIQGLGTELKALTSEDIGGPPTEEVLACVAEAIGSLKEVLEQLSVWASTDIPADMLRELSASGLSASLYLLKEYYLLAEKMGKEDSNSGRSMKMFLPRFVILKSQHEKLRTALTALTDAESAPKRRKKKGTGKVQEDFGSESPPRSKDESTGKTLKELLGSN